MRLYIVEREGGDGVETDCFESIELAERWRDVCGGIIREEETWDKAFLEEMIASYEGEEGRPLCGECNSEISHEDESESTCCGTMHSACVASHEEHCNQEV